MENSHSKNNNSIVQSFRNENFRQQATIKLEEYVRGSKTAEASLRMTRALLRAGRRALLHALLAKLAHSLARIDVSVLDIYHSYQYTDRRTFAFI